MRVLVDTIFWMSQESYSQLVSGLPLQKNTDLTPCDA